MQIIEMIHRGWSDSDIAALMGGNLMRIMDKVQDVGKSMAGKPVSRAIYDKRTDLPAPWGGEGMAYIPRGVKDYILKRRHDEL
jgi:membrane dipeptidase